MGCTPPTVYHIHCCRIHTSLILIVLESFVKFCLKDIYMLEQATTFEETKAFSRSVCMTITWTLKRHKRAETIIISMLLLLVVSLTESKLANMSLKCNKVVGIDDLRAEVLKCYSLLEALLVLFNKCFTTSIIPFGNKALLIPFLNRHRLTAGTH